ncbi:unnamed protein product [Cyclocybe aegerita]|uniref:Uncharacterized protein n=1 Tax=Cyclocybe aegerita TaxID=1973307 RepID=A0A8S0WJ53_CYCAE|nr:unnamed protein product [Cyclocybe aegerita]
MDGQADNVLAPEGDLGELLGSQQFRNGVPPFAQYNVIYLLDFFIPPEADCVRFPLAVALDEQTFKKVFGSSQEEIALVAQRNNITARARHANFIPARKGLTVHRTPVRDEDHWPEFPEFVNKTVPTMGAHYGPDMADVTRPITPACTNMVSEILEYKIWGIFASSLIQKISSPKRRTESSVSTYCNIQMIDREKLKNEVMNSVELHGVFTQVHWKRASEKEWTATFNHLFPIKNWKPPRYHQHYPYMEYFLHYTALLDNVDHETAGKIREALWAKVRDLMWLPAANGERVWIYGLSDGFVGVPYPRESGPHILVNPYVHDEPSVVPPPGPPPAPEPEIGPRFLREEEEESSEEE